VNATSSSGVPVGPNVAALLAAYGAWQAATMWLSSALVRNVTEAQRAAVVAWFGSAERDGNLLRQVPALTDAAERLVKSQAEWGVAWTKAQRASGGQRD
jgi:hypothetical protein